MNLIIFILALILAGCSPAGIATGTPVVDPTPLPSATPRPTHTATPLPSATPTPTGEPTVTSTATIAPGPYTDPRLYTIELFGGVYSYFDFSVQKENIYPIHVDELTISGSGPANANEISFANTQKIMAYWVYKKSLGAYQLVLSDLENTESRPVYTDTVHLYDTSGFENFSLIWSDDDTHLFLHFWDGLAPDLMYDLQSQQTQSWPYDCDRVALSPQTGNMALWCPSLTLGQFAVMEWGGDIWVSDSAPETELVRRRTPPVNGWDQQKPQIWKWSPDGSMIAYFDTQDARSPLYVVNSKGEKVLTNTQVGAYWSVKDNPGGLPPIQLIRWSNNNEKLLLYGVGKSGNDCPAWMNEFEEKPQKRKVPCWHVIDLESNQVVWSIGTLVQVFPSDQYISLTKFHNAEFSPDGNYIAIASTTSSTDYLDVIDLLTNEVSFSWSLPIYSMIWR